MSMGPYPTAFSVNFYIVSFIDLYSDWTIYFLVARKDGDTLAQLLLDEIYSRFGLPLMILTDNGSEYCNSVMKVTLEAMNIAHSLYLFAKASQDTTGPYPTSSGNLYIVSFIDLYSGWPISFLVARKDGGTIAHLL